MITKTMLTIFLMLTIIVYYKDHKKKAANKRLLEETQDRIDRDIQDLEELLSNQRKAAGFKVYNCEVNNKEVD